MCSSYLMNDTGRASSRHSLLTSPPRKAHFLPRQTPEVQSVQSDKGCVAVVKTLSFATLLLSSCFPSNHFHPSK